MSTATFSVGPGESYRHKATGRMTTLVPGNNTKILSAQHFEKVPSGAAPHDVAVGYHGRAGGNWNAPNSKQIADDIRNMRDDILREPYWLTYGDLHAGWNSPRHLFNPGGPKTDIPAFVEPERPAEPKPEPDSPAVAMLRRLLEDREARVRDYEEEVEGLQQAIEDIEESLETCRGNLDHRQACADAASDEVEQIREQIVALGGSV